MSFLSRYEELGEIVDVEVKPKPSLRINTLKIEESKAIAILKKKQVKLEKIPFVPHGYWYEAEFSLGATPEYLQGWYYLQETASQLSPIVLDPKKEDIVLDMAAAPGSKTTQIAQLMKDKGVIVALDNDAMRLISLKNNVERLGITSVLAYKKDARFTYDLGIKFDKILLDAPCSGNYCIEQNYFTKKTVAGIEQRARLQKELLKSAYKSLKQDGILVYSTCSLEPEENELIIDWFLEKFEDMQLQETGLTIGDKGLTKVFDQELNKEIEKTRRFWPHKTKTQGFFIAKLHKK